MQPNVPEVKQMNFQKYPSIQNTYREKIIKLIRQEGYDSHEITWLALEKIHGANFSIHYSGLNKIAKYGRRTDFLTKDIPVPCQNPEKYFNQSFNNAGNYVKNFHNNLPHIFQNVKQKFPEAQIVQIYGEYFGGGWPQDQEGFVEGVKCVQKGVIYTPNYQFMAFDIQITTSNSTFWVDVSEIASLLQKYINHVPIFLRGTFDQILAVQTIIDSTIPELFGFKKLQKNVIEGMIFRPNSNISFKKTGERVILKKKNQQFLQKFNAPKIIIGKQQIQKGLQPYLQQLIQYLNVNRIESVISKFPDQKDRLKIKAEVIEDILVDAKKDQYKGPKSQQINKKLKSQFDKLVMKQINNYFAKK